MKRAAKGFGDKWHGFDTAIGFNTERRAGYAVTPDRRHPAAGCRANYAADRRPPRPRPNSKAATFTPPTSDIRTPISAGT